MKKFEQMKRLYQTIHGYMSPYDFSDEMVSGLTADFDRLFELSWKVLKEYMQNNLMMLEARTGSPKDIIKLAYKQHLIDDENLWINMLKDRNDDTHHYKSSAAILYTGRITDGYLNVIKKLIDSLKELIPEEEISDVRVPDSFIQALKDSNMSLDAFVRKIKGENNFVTDDDIFIHWEEVKAKYM